jgi:UDP-glucose 4-epimerase
MKILVTGGAGFIGREVVRQLIAGGNLVICFDDFSFGKEDNIKEFIANPNFILSKGDILNEKELTQVFVDYQPETLIHLAAVHFIPFCNEFPKKTIDINTTGTFNLFNVALKHGIKRILFASSGAIYPNSQNPLDEAKDLPAPVDTYGISKLLGENICTYFASKFESVVFVAMRFFNAFGPYETNPHLIPEIVEQIKANGDWVSLGNVETKRDYIFTEDISRAIVILTAERLSSSGNYFIYNIGTGVQYSGKELVSSISKIMGKNITIKSDPSRFRPSDKPYQIASIAKINKAFGWSPQYSVEEGLLSLLTFEKLI